MERYLTCGNPDCKCARGERHGPVWYLSVTLDQSHRAGCTVPGDQVEQVRQWIENYHRVKESLEKISIRTTVGVENLKAGDTTTVDVVAQLKEMW